MFTKTIQIVKRDAKTAADRAHVLLITTRKFLGVTFHRAEEFLHFD